MLRAGMRQVPASPALSSERTCSRPFCCSCLLAAHQNFVNGQTRVPSFCIQKPLFPRAGGTQMSWLSLRCLCALAGCCIAVWIE